MFFLVTQKSPRILQNTPPSEPYSYSYTQKRTLPVVAMVAQPPPESLEGCATARGTPAPRRLRKDCARTMNGAQGEHGACTSSNRG